MEIVQEIGAYAGLAAILGLALLSALYFSQARDVKRLREWAGRAPERPAQEAVPSRVVAQPVPKPGGQLPARPAPPPVPRPPGAQGVTGAAPAVASATGAAPAVATGPAMATPAAKAVQAEGSREAEEGGGAITGDTSAEAATAGGETAAENGEAATENGTGAVDALSEPGGDRSDDEAPADEPADDETGEQAGDELDETATDGEGEAGPEGESEAEPDGETGGRPPVRQETEEWDPVETGEWRPEDEHSDYELLPGQDPEPTPLPTVRPPVPPRPYGGPRTASPAAAVGRGERSEQGRILPDYADVRPAAENGRRRRKPLLVVGGAVGVMVVVVAALQLTGGGDEPAPTPTPVGEQRQSGSGGGGGSPAPRIDPATVTVAVLNGTTVPGLAATIGDKIASEGFQRGTVTNSFDQERAESVVLYAPDAEREAEVVGRRLDIAQREPIDPGSQELAGDATVVVVAGADQAQ